MRTEVTVFLLSMIVVSPALADMDLSLIIAASKGQTTTMEDLLGQGADVNGQDEYGNTALTFAAGNGHLGTVLLLLDSGGIVDAKNKYGETALMGAARNGHHRIVLALLEEGADINASSNNGNSVLSWARQGGHKDTVGVLLSKLAQESVSQKPAKQHNQTQDKTPPIKSLGWNKIIDNTHLRERKNLITAMAVAALIVVIGQLMVSRYKNVIISKKGRGVDVKAKDIDGRTALIGAAMNGHTEIVRILLSKGAEFDAKDKGGSTAMMSAVKYGHTEIANLLKEAGAKE